MTSRNEPRLRFKGFSDEWNLNKLGNVGKIKMNKRIFKNETSKDGEVPFFKIGTFGKTPDAFISRKKFIELKSKYPYPKIGDILLSASGTLGRTVVYHGEDAYFQDSNIIWLDTKSNIITNDFLYQFYKQHRWTKSEGSTIKRLYNKDINNTPINLPSLPEQQHIGNFFSKLDYLIDLHSQKLEKLKKLKRGYLQKMFPQKGETVPRLRFSGFSGKWKEIRLKNISRCETSKYTQGQFKKEPNKGIYKVYDVSGTSGSMDVYDQENNYISIVKDGSGVGTVNLRPAKTSIINTMNYIINDNSNIRYLFYLLETFNFYRYKIGTGIPHIYYSDYSNEKVRVPSIDEQKKIGSFFNNLDKKIKFENDKIEALNRQKKAYLQKMFI